MTRPFALLPAIAAALVAAAQPPAWSFHYPQPRADAVRVTRDVPFATADTLTLAMDVYRPARAAGASPALVLWSTFVAGEPRERPTNDYLSSWARLAAASGIVAVVPDLRAEPGTGNATTPSRALGDDFSRLTAHLVEHAARYGIDRERIALFAASGAVAAALPAVQDSAQRAIRAAVLYYGWGDVPTFRPDVPMLYVRAGLDTRGMNAGVDRTVARALAQNVPLTLLNHHGGHHGFEGADDDAATRRTIEETLAFVKRATAPAYQAAVRARGLEASAAAHRNAGNHREAALAFAELVRRRPDDPRARLDYAGALLADRQFAPACAEFRRVAPPAFAAIEPGARACVLAGAVDTAAAWLATFRREWLRSEYLRRLHSDSVFAPLWTRSDFQALFRP